MANQIFIETAESLNRKREKRRWQMALRRYIIEKNPSNAYAKYFGLDITYFREWVSLQFKNDLSWESFAIKWQFDHIVPVAYFDYSKEEDLLLCWNFINIRVERIEQDKFKGNKIDVMAVRTYFEDLFSKTKYPFCIKMLEKISKIEMDNIETNTELVDFVINNKQYIEQISNFSQDDFSRLNSGVAFKSIQEEKEIARKFGY